MQIAWQAAKFWKHSAFWAILALAFSSRKFCQSRTNFCGSAMTIAHSIKMDSSTQRPKKMSMALLAVCLFVCVNFAFAVYIKYAHVSRLQMATRNWSWWATTELLSHKEPVDVLLMGSSLVQRLLDEGEATYMNKKINGVTHRNSLVLEDALSGIFHRPVRTWSFAVGGLHASDASLVTTAFLKGEHQPAAIVYGIAPRDLMNNLLASPCATDTFQLVTHVSDQRDIGLKSRSSNAERFDYLVSSGLNSVLPMFDFHAELSQCFRRDYKKGTDKLVNNFVPTPVNPFGTLDMIRLHMSPEECEGELPISPFNPAFPTHEDNKSTYLFAYKPFRAKFYNLQKDFLERMLQTSAERGIQVVFVNMPLRADNFEAMEPGFYDLYKKDLCALASKYHADFIDMNRPQTFAYADFSDQVHLNGAGAVKLAQTMAPELGKVLRKPAVALSERKPAQLTQ
jgi:hypothetical protein